MAYNNANNLRAPRMSSSERDAMAGVENGWTIYNTTLSAFQARINGSWVSLGAAGGGSINSGSALIDFGAVEVDNQVFNVVNALIAPSSQIMASLGWSSATLRDADEMSVDPVSIVVEPLTGSMNIHASALEGTVSGKYLVNYQFV